MKKLLTIALALLICSPVFAVDYWGGPPEGSWNRGEPGSTFEHYTFDEPIPGGPCPFFDNPFGEPMFDLMGMWEYGQWECPPELDERGFVNGFHCISPEGGSIILTIPNTDAVDGEKKIFIQITSSKGPSDVSVNGMGENPDGYTTEIWPTGRPQIQWPQPAPYGGVWYTYNYGFIIRPNPQMETITITVPYCTVVDQIVVDTICTGTVAAEQSSLDSVKALYR
jgi:hypothetical protein